MPIASDLAGTANPGGSTGGGPNRGRAQGSGNRMAPGGGGLPLNTAAVAAAVAPPRRPMAPPPGRPQAGPGGPPRFSAANPPLGTAPPPVPHPGLRPPYPDARSPAPTLMPNGVPVMPPPSGFPLAGAIPRVPLTMAPAAASSPAPPSGPPTMPPIHQSHMPTMANSMQMAHLPPGGAPMPSRPGQTPQATRRPGMSGLLGGAGGGARPVPGGPPVRAPDGHHYIHKPHAGGLYHRVG